MIKEAEAKAYYLKNFPETETRTFYSHGRLEIIGNHTDHNRGLCLVAGADLGITAIVSPRDDGVVCVASQGFKPFTFSIDNLEAGFRDKGSTRGITRGILAGMKKLGLKVGGFNAACVNDIPAGSGISSSACYESLICHIVDVLYNDKKCTPIAMARIGQFAENVYFGKNSGLLDQIGTSFGGVCFLDFQTPDHVLVEPIAFDLPLDITLVNTPSSHSGLNGLYGSIPHDMKNVAKVLFDKDVLREVTREEFMKASSQPTYGVSERAKLRAQHYFDENERVLQAKEAFEHHDVGSFLTAIRQSQISSQTLLANTMIPGRYANSPQEAIDRANQFIGKGACRIMGGGFAGSILCFTTHDETEHFRKVMGDLYGKENVCNVSLYEGGPHVVGE